MRPAGGVQLVVGNRASVLVWAVGGQVLCSHTGGVLRLAGQKKGSTGSVNVGEENKAGEIDDKTRMR